MRIYYSLDLLLSKLSKAQSNGKFRERKSTSSGFSFAYLLFCWKTSLDKNKSRRSDHQLHSELCYCTALFSAIFQLYSWSCYCTALFPTIQLYSQPCYCTALFLAMSNNTVKVDFIPPIKDYELGLCALSARVGGQCMYTMSLKSNSVSET